MSGTPDPAGAAATGDTGGTGPEGAGHVVEGAGHGADVAGGAGLSGDVVEGAGAPGRSSGAAQVVAAMTRLKVTVAVAESLTGGLIGATFTSVPGSSQVFRGGVISYATDLKHQLLGVPEDLLRREGAVHPEVAAEMAAGVARLCEATYGLAVTGVAGPEPQDGQPVGTVFAALSGPDGQLWSRRLRLEGSRERIRVETVDEAIDLLASVLKPSKGEHSG
ncbi:CinA family protein [Nonomuraea sp. NPDC048826]|uniref:CinA family protein n=1 Tax=Nonomuraea sp. NPDC048826 TaxID=3364347 RepID=UPI003717FA6E